MKKILLVVLVCLASTAQAEDRGFLRNDSAATIQGSNLEPSAASVNSVGALQVNIDSSFQTGTSLIRTEDAAHTSGQPGIMALGVFNSSLNQLAGTDGDYSPIGVGARGDVFTTLWYDNAIASGGPIRLEDDNAANATSGLATMGVINTTSAVRAINDDFTFAALDTAGRTITTAAASTSMVQGCNTAVTTATTGSMIAAVASNFTFITSWSCTNTGAAATRVILEDGDGTDLANVMLAATTGFATVTFPTPVRTNVVNKAIQINVITTSSSTICCASGYTGII